LGFGVWPQTPNPQSPIPNPQSPIPNEDSLLKFEPIKSMNLKLINIIFK